MTAFRQTSTCRTQELQWATYVVPPACQGWTFQPVQEDRAVKESLSARIICHLTCSLSLDLQVNHHPCSLCPRTVWTAVRMEGKEILLLMIVSMISTICDPHLPFLLSYALKVYFDSPGVCTGTWMRNSGLFQTRWRSCSSCPDRSVLYVR